MTWTRSMLVAICTLCILAVNAAAAEVSTEPAGRIDIADIVVSRGKFGRSITATLCMVGEHVNNFDWTFIGTTIGFRIVGPVNPENLGSDLDPASGGVGVIAEGIAPLMALDDNESNQCRQAVMQPGVALAGEYELSVTASPSITALAVFNVPASIAVIASGFLEIAHMDPEDKLLEYLCDAVEGTRTAFPTAEIDVFVQADDWRAPSKHVLDERLERYGVAIHLEGRIINVRHFAEYSAYFTLGYPSSWWSQYITPQNSVHFKQLEPEQGILFPADLFPDIASRPFENGTLEDLDLFYSREKMPPYYMDEQSWHFIAAVLQFDPRREITIVSSADFHLHDTSLQFASELAIKYIINDMDKGTFSDAIFRPRGKDELADRTITVYVFTQLSEHDKLKALSGSLPIVGVAKNRWFLRALMAGKAPVVQYSRLSDYWKEAVEQTTGITTESPLYKTLPPMKPLMVPDGTSRWKELEDSAVREAWYGLELVERDVIRATAKLRERSDGYWKRIADIIAATNDRAFVSTAEKRASSAAKEQLKEEQTPFTWLERLGRCFNGVCR